MEAHGDLSSAIMRQKFDIAAGDTSLLKAQASCQAEHWQALSSSTCELDLAQEDAIQATRDRKSADGPAKRLRPRPTGASGGCGCGSMGCILAGYAALSYT